jgi:hypothetical protein
MGHPVHDWSSLVTRSIGPWVREIYNNMCHRILIVHLYIQPAKLEGENESELCWVFVAHVAEEVALRRLDDGY